MHNNYYYKNFFFIVTSNVQSVSFGTIRIWAKSNKFNWFTYFDERNHSMMTLPMAT